MDRTKTWPERGRGVNPKPNLMFYRESGVIVDIFFKLGYAWGQNLEAK